jgi:hypothetical protein
VECCKFQCSEIIRRAASLRRGEKGELRHSGASSMPCHTATGLKRLGGTGSRGAQLGIRFPPVPTENGLSAARAQARRQPNFRARLQLTSSWPSRSRDSRLLPMVGNRPCQRIKTYVSTVYILTVLLAPALQVFASSAPGAAWQCGKRA